MLHQVQGGDLFFLIDGLHLILFVCFLLFLTGLSMVLLGTVVVRSSGGIVIEATVVNASADLTKAYLSFPSGLVTTLVGQNVSVSYTITRTGQTSGTVVCNCILLVVENCSFCLRCFGLQKVTGLWVR